MGWRLWRRKQLLPGVRLNLSRSGPSIRLGPRGAGINIGGRAGLRGTVGLPGAGVYYTTTAHRRARRTVPASRSYSGPSSSNSGAVGCIWVTGVIAGIALVIVTYGLILIPIAIGGAAWLWWRSSRPDRRAAKVIAHALALPGDQAVVVLHDAIAIDPDGPKTLAAAGGWFEDNKCWEDAAECYGGALHAKPDWNLEAKYTKSLLLAGRLDEAIPRLEQNRQLGWITEESRATMTSALAAAYLVKGDPDQALALCSQEPLQKHILDSGLQQCLYMRAVSRYILGQRAKAMADLDRLYAANTGYAGLAQTKAEMAAGTYKFSLGGPYPDWYPHPAATPPSAESASSAAAPDASASAAVGDRPAVVSPLDQKHPAATDPVPTPPADGTVAANPAAVLPPPPSLWVSPDGKWRWDGSAWVPAGPAGT